MIQPAIQPLRQRLETIETFFREVDPALADGMQEAIHDIEQKYLHAQQPFGAGKALEWFESEYVLWCEQRDIRESSVQEQVAQAIEEGRTLGDFDADGLPNEKAIARNAALTCTTIVARADDESRGLTTYERFHLEYTLTLSLAQIRQMSKQRP